MTAATRNSESDTTSTSKTTIIISNSQKQKVREKKKCCGMRGINTCMIEIEERLKKRDHTTGHMHLNELKILQCDTLFLVKCIHHIHIFLVQKMLAARFITPRIPNYNTDAHRE